MRAEPNLFELCRAIATSTKSKECPKGLIAERWGVKSQVTLYQHIVEYQQQHSTSVFLLLSHCVTAPLRKRSTWLPFTATTLIIKSISKWSSFCQRGQREAVRSLVTGYSLSTYRWISTTTQYKLFSTPQSLRDSSSSQEEHPSFFFSLQYCWVSRV